MGTHDTTKNEMRWYRICINPMKYGYGILSSGLIVDIEACVVREKNGKWHWYVTSGNGGGEAPSRELAESDAEKFLNFGWER